MNEVTKVHLGRQPFTISVDAYSELRIYLDDIKKHVKDKDVLNEIELRMAELLSEHGITAKKVVLISDVDYLRKQLGDPKDFSTEEDDDDDSEDKSGGKRLFRDMSSGKIAGVASGLGNYFGIDALIVRLIFVFLVLVTAGWGILLYLILWLLVPEAKTSSDQLRMAGKPVTVDNLKRLVDNADIKGVASKTGNTLVDAINTIFSLILKVLGIVFVLFGLSAIFGLISFGVYFFLNRSIWSKYNIFPVGFKEHMLLYIVGIVIALVAVFIVLFGIAIFRRKWPIHTWVTGVLIGLIVLGVAISSGLAADVYPAVRDRYNNNLHVTNYSVNPFSTVYINSTDEEINFVQSNKYGVTLNYFGHPNLTKIGISSEKGTLTIDTSNFNNMRDCPVICIPNSHNLEITIDSPQANELNNQFNNFTTPFPPNPLKIEPIPFNK